MTIERITVMKQVLDDWDVMRLGATRNIHEQITNRIRNLSLEVTEETRISIDGAIEIGKFQKNKLIKGMVILHKGKQMMCGTFEDRILVIGQKLSVNNNKIEYFSDGTFVKNCIYTGFELNKNGQITQYFEGKAIKKGDNMMVSAAARNSLKTMNRVVQEVFLRS